MLRGPCLQGLLPVQLFAVRVTEVDKALKLTRFPQIAALLN